MARAAVLLLALALAACLTSGAHALNITAKDVAGAVLGEDGQYKIVHEGADYIVIDDPNRGMPFFVNKETQSSSWSDPRTAGQTEGDININLDESAFPDLKSKSKPRSTATLIAVALVPVLAIAGIMAGRIYYLQTYYPELLWPTKERKLRARNNQKFKAQKARGKMSQDGKGGRSANS